MGFLGLVFHIKNNPKDTWSVFLLFIFTGLAIVVELNQTPFQPRERDYAYVGSFYAFSIWAGMGVLSIYNTLKERGLNNKKLLMTICSITLFVPLLMANQGWDDHDRSNRFTAREFAKNYLKSCEPNAILFTMGDNDTFPLWYVQEVEGYRTDVRIVNLSLLNTDWYIDQMKRDAYDGKAVPFSLNKNKYKQGTRDVAIYLEKGEASQKRLELTDFNKWIKSDRKETKIDFGKDYDYYYTKKIRIPVNKENIKHYKFQNDSILDYLDIELKTSQLEKKDIMILDLLENNDWERPIYFAITIGSSGRQFLYLEKYFRLDGMVYKLMPIDYSNSSEEIGGINTDILYPILIDDEPCSEQLRIPKNSTNSCNYAWGNLNSNIYLDETNIRMTMNFRNNFSRLAQELIKENKFKKAENVLDYCMKTMPPNKVPLNYFIHPIIESYYQLNANEKANNLTSKLANKYTSELEYYFSFPTRKINGVQLEILKNLQFFNQLVEIAQKNKHEDNNLMQQDFEKYYRKFLVL